MPWIRFRKNLAPIEVRPQSNLMKELLNAGLPVASSCHGDGICGKCRIEIVNGMDQLSPPNAQEQILRDRLRIPNNIRISCQTLVCGDVTVDTSYW